MVRSILNNRYTHFSCIKPNMANFSSLGSLVGTRNSSRGPHSSIVLIHRRYIDSGQLDFYRHDEYCTGRCVARTPISTTPGEKATASAFTRRRPLAMVPFIPPDFPAEKKLVRSPIPKVEFVGSINEHTYCHLPDDSERLAPGQDEPEDVKPDMTLLQNFIKRSSGKSIFVC